MLPEHLTVPLANIARDNRTYQISTQSDPRRLAASLARWGLLHAPILVQRAEQYVIVSGFARVDAAVLLGWSEIPGRVLRPEANHEMCVTQAILDNSSHRPLDLVEQSRCLRLLQTIASEEKQLIALANQLGLCLNPKMAIKLLMVGQMSQVLQEGLIHQSIALPVALDIHQMDDDETIQALGSFLAELNLSLNRQREILDWMDGIAHREGVPILEILKTSAISDLRSAHDVDQRQRSEKIREYLKKRRYPSIDQAEERYRRYHSKVYIPKEIQLKPPPYFEGDVYSLHINFKTPDNLKKIGHKVCELADSQALKELLENN